jgi:glycine hydroxymethyltransferase
MAAYFALIKPGQTILGMDLAHGGHLTHGSKVSFSGKLFQAVSYGVSRETETIDYEQVRALAREHQPALILAGASAYPRVIDFQAFADIAREVSASLVVDMAHVAGLVAAGVHPSPVPHADIVTTTTHKTLRGPRGGMILSHKEMGAKIDSNIFPGIQGGPLMHIIAAKAVALKLAAQPEFKQYQQQVIKNAQRLAKGLKTAGFRLVSGGADNHMLLLDVSPQKLTGRDAEIALDQAGITTNKNAIPFDPKPPKITSGLRIGAPAVTTRGMTEEEMDEIVQYISDVLARPDDPANLRQVREKVQALCDRFPLYEGLDFFH